MEKRKHTGEIQRIWREDAEYPRRLREIPGAPDSLYLIGELPSEEYPAVAIIGARDCSDYGRYVAMELGRVLGQREIQVISGMARGIDGIAQKAALEVGGRSFAVLGSGVDVCYPAGNERLYEQLKTGGGILSEYAPGTKALARNFPPRNRIVSGLADGVVVVEARIRSGTLITVDMALEQGREVYAIPGRITDRLSDGCNKLIKLGAAPVLDYEEFAEEIWELFRRKKYFPIPGEGRPSRDLSNMTKKEMKKELNTVVREQDDCVKITEKVLETGDLPPELLELMGALDIEPRSLEQICRSLPGEKNARQMIPLLMRLCAENRAVQTSPGHFRIRYE